MRKRQKLSNRKSKKMFTATAGAQKVHPKNYGGGISVTTNPMRGGIRL